MLLTSLAGFAAIACAIVVNKIMLQHLPLIFYVGLRALIAGGVLFLYARKKTDRFRWSYLKADWAGLVFVALLTTLVPALLKAYGIKYMLASKAGLIGSLDPFMTALYAYVLFSERLTRRKLLGIGVAFAGALMLCLQVSPVEQTLHAFLFFSLPELAAFGAVALARLGWLGAQHLLKAGRYSPIELNAVTMLISGAIGLGWAALLERGCSYAALTTPWVLCTMAYSILVGNVLGFTLYGHTLKRYSASFASLLGFSTPVFIVFFSWLLLGEKPTPLVGLAGLVIGLGVFLFYREELNGQ